MSAAPQTLADLIDPLPVAVQARVRKGVAIVSRLPDEVRSSAIKSFLESFESAAGSINVEALADRVHISRYEASNLMTALSVVASVLSQCAASPEEFAREAKGKLFEEVDEQTTLALVRTISGERDRLELSFERRKLAASTLPTMTDFEVSVDLRFRFSKEAIQDAVPVALVHIDTDTRPEIWFQMTKGDVDMMCQRLLELKSWMETVREFFERAQLVSKK